jgi:hypothetical protein
MKLRNLGFILLAVWLIAVGAVGLLKLNFPYMDMILAALAIAAGILMILPVRGIKGAGNLGVLFLSIYLIASGALALLPVTIPASEAILALLAIVAGVLLLLKRWTA